jgi:hypothetical protein
MTGGLFRKNTTGNQGLAGATILSIETKPSTTEYSQGQRESKQRMRDTQQTCKFTDKVFIPTYGLFLQVHGQSVHNTPNPQSQNSQGSPAHQTKSTTTREWSTTTHVRELTQLAFDATSCFRLSLQEAKLLPVTRASSP